MENLAIVVGRLGADPELKYTPNETPVARFSMATSDKWADKRMGAETAVCNPIPQ